MEAYPRVLSVSSPEAGVTAQIIVVLALPPKDDWRIRVNLLSRKLTNCLHKQQAEHRDTETYARSEIPACDLLSVTQLRYHMAQHEEGLVDGAAFLKALSDGPGGARSLRTRQIHEI